MEEGGRQEKEEACRESSLDRHHRYHLHLNIFQLNV